MTVLIPYAGLTPVSWKNGGGTTIEIAVGPPDAGFDDFDWRVSLATIASDGAFSRFPGVARTLALVEGHGMTLRIDDAPVMVNKAAPVVCFAGEAQVQATLGRGQNLDFNVMTRKGRCVHQFGQRRVSGSATFVARADVTMLFLAHGDNLQLSSDKERLGLVRFDAVLLEPGSTWTIECGQGTLFIVEIDYPDGVPGERADA